MRAKLRAGRNARATAKGRWREVLVIALALMAAPAVAGGGADASATTPGPNSWAAHGAAPLKSVETLVIHAPPDKVWAVTSDFAHYDWLPGVVRVDAHGGNTPEQAKRRLLMQDGGEVDDTLVRWDSEKRTLAFHRDRDDVKRLPAINYMQHVTVKPAENGDSLVEWKGRFYRGHPFNDPPPGLDDDVATAAVTALHRASLAALKAKVEGR